MRPVLHDPRLTALEPVSKAQALRTEQKMTISGQDVPANIALHRFRDDSHRVSLPCQSQFRLQPTEQIKPARRAGAQAEFFLHLGASGFPHPRPQSRVMSKTTDSRAPLGCRACEVARFTVNDHLGLNAH